MSNYQYVPKNFYPTFPNEIIEGILQKNYLPDYIEVDRHAFIQMLLNSCSLNLIEKVRTIDAMPILSQYQVDALQKVFIDEQEEFEKLYNEHPDEIAALIAQTIISIFTLAVYLQAIPEDKKAEENMIANVVQHYRDEYPEFFELLQNHKKDSAHIKFLLSCYDKYSTLNAIKDQKEFDFLTGSF